MAVCFMIKIKSRAGYCTELSANLGRVSFFHGDLFFRLCVHNAVFMLLLPAGVFFLRHFGFGFLYETVFLGETSHAFDGFPDSIRHFLNRLAFVIGENVAFLGCGQTVSVAVSHRPSETCVPQCRGVCCRCHVFVFLSVGILCVFCTDNGKCRILLQVFKNFSAMPQASFRILDEQG
jgi:hypothetical protein